MSTSNKEVRTNRAWRLILGLPIYSAVLLYLVTMKWTMQPDWLWQFETLSNLRPHLAWAGITGAAFFFLLRFRIAGSAVALIAGVYGAIALTQDPPRAAKADEPNLRVMSVNIGRKRESFLFHIDRDNRRLVDATKAEAPDVLVLIEDRRAVRDSLANEMGDFPFRAGIDFDDRTLSVYSRYPLSGWRSEPTDLGKYFMTGHVAAGGRRIFFIAAHPPSPLDGIGAHQRERVLERIAEIAREATEPVILAGDLNLTGQSVFFVRLLKNGGLYDTARGMAPVPTWVLPIPSLGLRIDHVLVSREIAVAARRVGPGFRSDHRPLTVDLAIPGEH